MQNEALTLVGHLCKTLTGLFIIWLATKRICLDRMANFKAVARRGGGGGGSLGSEDPPPPDKERSTRMYKMSI